MMKGSIRVRAVACCLTTIGAMLIGSQANATERELAAHQHGHGFLNIAIEGSTMWIELETPGADIVGFEHPARSDADKAAIADATARLGDPVGLFGIPSQASCTLETVTVSPVGYGLGMDDDHDTDSDHDAHDEHANEEESFHAEFYAEYSLQCADPAAITSLIFTYFDVFPGAEEVQVTVITEDGQGGHEVTGDSPIMRLARTSASGLTR